VKFQPDRLEGVNVISRLDRGRIWVNADEHASSILVPWRGPVRPWRVTGFADLRHEHFDAVLDLEPEVVIFGSGTRLRFVTPALQRVLIERRIGVETMDSAAACRTYNVLANEGRRVVAALLIETFGP
jgi:uncharacterized protein